MTAEQRRFQRVPQSWEVGCRHPDGPLVWYEALTLNVSAGGLELQSAVLFEVGAVLELRIRLPDHPEPFYLRGRVVWNKPDGLNDHGVEFVDVTLGQQVRIDELVKFLAQ